MNKTLPEFIEETGIEESARIFSVKTRTVESWKRRERYPRTAKAVEIIEATDGAVDYAGIYGPAEQDAA